MDNDKVGTIVEMEFSEKFGEIAKALAAAQADLKPVGTNKRNPHYKSQYADLSAYLEAALPALSKQGIAVTQIPMSESAECVRVVTILMHASEQWIRGVLSMRPEKNTAQGVGSAISYAKRYSLGAMIGLASTDEDDDGNAAIERAPSKKTTNANGKRVAPKQSAAPAKANGDALSAWLKDNLGKVQPGEIAEKAGVTKQDVIKARNGGEISEDVREKLSSLVLAEDA